METTGAEQNQQPIYDSKTILELLHNFGIKVSLKDLKHPTVG
jgi:hypothetical protein